MILAQLVAVASLSFSNGAEVRLARNDGPGPNVAAVSVLYKSFPLVVIWLNKHDAQGWAWNAAQLASGDTAFGEWRKTIIGPLQIRNKVSCGKVWCEARLIRDSIFTAPTRWMQPGPIPKDQLRTISRLLYYVAGDQPDSAITIPWIWKGP